MPTLNRYTQNSDQTGYYIRANVGGSSPVTLQVSALARRVFRLLGCTDGDPVPAKLVWSMYDLGLLYTLSSFTTEPERSSSGDVAAFVEELESDSSLSSGEREHIIDQLERYEGPDTEEIEALIERLQGTGFSRAEAAEIGDAVPLLLKWAENPSAYEELVESIEKYEEFAAASIRTFARHPHVEAPPVTFCDDGGIRYELSHENYSETVYVRDRRFHSLSYSYEVVVEHSNGGREIAYVSRSGYISEYENDAGRRGLRMKVESMLEWVLPDSRITVPVDSGAGFTEYEGEELEVMKKIDDVDEGDLFVGTIDRISNSGNLIVQKGDHHLHVDEGEVGETYLIERLSSNAGRVLSRFKSDSET